MYPSKKDFEILLKTHDIDWIIDNHIFGGPPFYSSNHPEVHDQVVRSISKGLNVAPSNICVIGSARIGFSLSPERFGEPFNQFSDIDIIIVSSSLFDPSWVNILEHRRTNRSRLGYYTKRRLKDHRDFHYIYNGWMYPESVVEALKIGERWLRTFNGLSRITELASRSIGSRLYRTWEHARLYHRWSLERVKNTIFH